MLTKVFSHPTTMLPPRLTLSLRGTLHLAFLSFTIGALFLAQPYFRPTEFRITVDGYSFPFKTRQQRIDAVLREARIELKKYDTLTPNSNNEAVSGGNIVVERAAPLKVIADGRILNVQTTASTIGEALEELDLSVSPKDLILKDGQPATPSDPLFLKSATEESSLATSDLLVMALNSPLSGQGAVMVPPRPSIPTTVEIKRAIPFYVHDGAFTMEIWTTKHTLAEGLLEAGMSLYRGDHVAPSLASPTTYGSHVYIRRSKGVNIQVDGRSLYVRTLKEVVGDVLEQEGITLASLDRIAPGLSTSLVDGMNVITTRVNEEVITEEASIPFKTRYVPNSQLEIDNQAVKQEGRNGVLKWDTKIVYENGKEVSRTKIKEWVDRDPVEKLIGYGTKIVVQQLDTPEGSVSYWRKMRVLATWYDASHGGKSRDDPRYGYTRLGLKAEKGIVAVDPSVIPFYTKMYIPGYGVGMAGDTGGAIRGKIIDLAFAEDEPKTWSSRWTEIYILTPVPPEGQIQWIQP